MRTIEPIHDRIIVKKIERADKTKGGLFIPSAAKGEPQEGEVLGVGPGRTDDKGQLVKPSVKVGDKILFAKYAGVEVFIDEEPFLIMRDEDILGILKEENKLKDK